MGIVTWYNLLQCRIKGCERRFTTIYNLNTHQKLHARPLEMVCPVETCGARFQTKRNLELHMKSHDRHHAPYKWVYWWILHIVLHLSRVVFQAGLLSSNVLDLHSSWDTKVFMVLIPSKKMPRYTLKQVVNASPTFMLYFIWVSSDFMLHNICSWYSIVKLASTSLALIVFILMYFVLGLCGDIPKLNSIRVCKYNRKSCFFDI